MRINKIKIEKEAYKQLETIVKKIAEENKIENVSEVNIKLFKEKVYDSLIKFAVIDDREDEEHIGQKNNLEKTISMNPKRKDPIFFEPIDIGYINNKYVKISVQGSPTHYSEPQEIVPLEQYEEMEIGIIVDDHLANADELLDLGLPDDLADKFRIDETTYGYAPIKDIEAIYGNLEYIAGMQGDAKFEELYGDKNYNDIIEEIE